MLDEIRRMMIRLRERLMRKKALDEIRELLIRKESFD